MLEPYNGMKSRYHCPECNNSEKTFVRYIDRETGNYLADEVGKCNRESKCGYHFSPKQFFASSQSPLGNLIKPNIKQLNLAKPIVEKIRPNLIKPEIVKPHNISYIDISIFKQSLNHYEQNNFVNFLLQRFGMLLTKEALSKYLVGTSKLWQGANVFWQIDFTGKIRTGKIMLYNSKTGRRIKEPRNYINWVHSVLKQPHFELKQCLFGEHLLRNNNKIVAISESEKTAIIASIYLPEFVWLACGSLQNLNYEKCKVLTNHKVVLFPDLNGFDKWKLKAKELSKITTFYVSDLLEKKATNFERGQGFDLADYLLNFPVSEFAGLHNNYEALFQKFDEWISRNKKGGFFDFGDCKFKITPKQA